jgi:hypothetical protein
LSSRVPSMSRSTQVMSFQGKAIEVPFSFKSLPLFIE